MACSSGAAASLGFSIIMLHNSSSASDEDVQTIMDQRKRRRMLSNRASARRSRMRKQKHLDELMAQVGHLSEEKDKLMKALNMTAQLYLNIQADNSILQAQLAELGQRLESLDEIMMTSFINSSSTQTKTEAEAETETDDWDYSVVLVNDHHPSSFFMASAAAEVAFPVM